MTTLSPENSLSARRSATFILVCSLICFEMGVSLCCLAWPWLVILLPRLLSAGLTRVCHHTRRTRVLHQSQVPPSITSVCTGALCPCWERRLQVKDGARPAVLWSALQHQPQNRHMHPFFTLLEELRTQHGFLSRGVTLKLWCFLEFAQTLVNFLWCFCQQFWYIATKWQ